MSNEISKLELTRLAACEQAFSDKKLARSLKRGILPVSSIITANQNK